MRIANYRVIGVCIAMLLAAGISIVMTPTKRLADNSLAINLETQIPKQFGEWEIDPTVIPLSVSPDIQANINRFYSQTLSRTYKNSRGERFMLSIAYGDDQSDSKQVHKPEICYPAQGFKVTEVWDAVLHTRFGPISVKRLEAQRGEHIEPITYWTTVGEQVVTSNFKKKLAEIDYGLNGFIPDGLLFRVSSIDRDNSQAFIAQAAFVSQLMDALDAPARKRIAGIAEAL
jgi:EpsI family protein